MTLVERVLPAAPFTSLADYTASGGGAGLEEARRRDAAGVIAELDASGLRGRGGAGFPTGTKWATVVANRSDVLATTVVVNGAEGEPGTFKDRAIVAANPYAVVEGALIAAHVAGASRVVFALKQRAATSRRVRAACDEVAAAGWSDGVTFEVFEGPDEYLYGEETALLEALDGRPPFPRLAPPYRRGVDEVVETPADVDSGSGLSGHVELAGPEAALVAPPALVDNVETLANVPAILARGAAWFRSVGTAESPGTIVCTVTGTTAHAGVGEVAMGTPLAEVLDAIGGGMPRGRTVKAIFSGVSTGPLRGAALATPLTYEAMAEAGSGLGSGGFIVVADDEDMVAVVAGASRFLAVESCGQCTPCKQDGQTLAGLLAKLSTSEADEHDVEMVRSCVATVADGARCSLAGQHEAIVTALLDEWPDEVAGHLDGRPAEQPVLIAELVDIVDGVATLDEHHGDKQPDWTYDEVDSGKTPVERMTDRRADVQLDGAETP